MASDWAPEVDLQMLQQRAKLLHKIRQFFYRRQVLEVETPILSSCGLTDPNIESFQTHFEGAGSQNGRVLYLRTSPEFHMKRLLAANSCPIFQIAKVFRQGECGNLHNPEFTLLEWYRPNYSVPDLISEVEALVMYLNPPWASLKSSETLYYRDVFQENLTLDPHRATVEDLRHKAQELGLTVVGLDTDGPDAKDSWLDLLMSHVIQPRLGEHRLSFLRDYPASQAALATILPGDPAVALRFELFYRGVELANGYQELQDPHEQQQRFEHELGQRKRQGKSSVPLDTRLIAALEQGLPDCSGVALGLDRLIMLMSGQQSIKHTIAFPLNRA